MGEKISVKFRLGTEGRARQWKYYLPENSQVIRHFLEPIGVWLEGVIIPGPAPETIDRTPASRTVAWQDSETLIRRFAHLLPDILRCVSEVSEGCVGLIYFNGSARHDDLFSLWPYLPFGPTDERRFYIGEIRKDLRTEKVGVGGRVCTEYDYESVKQMMAPDAFAYSYGTSVMGLLLAESKVRHYLSVDVRDKSTLEECLRDEDVRCWWFCDVDFEGVAIWHKDHSASDLLKQIRAQVRLRAEELCLRIEGDAA